MQKCADHGVKRHQDRPVRFVQKCIRQVEMPSAMSGTTSPAALATTLRISQKSSNVAEMIGIARLEDAEKGQMPALSPNLSDFS